MEKQIIWQAADSGRSVWPLAVRAGQLIFMSGLLPIGPRTGRLIDGYEIPSDVAESIESLKSGSILTDDQEVRMAAQIWFLYNRIDQLLRQLGSSKDDILLINGWLADFREWPVMNRLRGKLFGPGRYPPSTTFGIPGVGFPGARALFETIALADGPLQKESLGSSQQVGFYYPGSKAGPFLFLAGDVAADPERGVIVRGYSDLDPEGQRLATGQLGPDGWEGKIRAQAWFIYRRIKHLLEASGSSLEHIVKQNIYIRDPRDYPAFEGISRLIFGDRLPPTTAVVVDEYGHREFILEIEVTAITSGSPSPERITSQVVPSLGPFYATAVRADPLLFISGQLPIDPNTGELTTGSPGVRGKSELAALQASRIYDNIEAFLGEQGLALDALLRQVIYVDDPNLIPVIERAAAARTKNSPPATTVVPTRLLWPAGSLVQIDFTALT